MGIQGLLVKLKGITHKVHVREYTGLMAGIDAYCWLHRGAYTCCTELVLGKSTDKYIRYCMEKLQMLIENGVTPIVVFDGASISVKRERNADRRRIRDESREKGFELDEKGQHEEARRLFQKAVVITHEMAHQFIKALKAAGIQFVVAPYEADAQLAYLSMKGIIDVVITEDSDTIPYGCRKVLFKLQKDGTGEEIERRNLGANAELDFQNWTDNMFLDMCLLAGCDYLPNVAGIGIMTAYKLVKQHRTYKKVIHALKAMTNIQLPDGYLELFAKARLTFRHHFVYEPDEKCIVALNPLKEAHLELDLSFLGQRHDSLLAQAIAQGDVHPESHRPFTPPSLSHAAASTITDQVPAEEARGEGGSTMDDRVVPSGSQKQQPPKQWADDYRQIKPAWQTSSPSGDSSNGHVESYQAFGAKTALYSRQLSLQAANQAAHVQANRCAEAAAELQASASLRLGTAESIDLPNVVQGSANIALGSRRQSLARPSAPPSHRGGQPLQQQLPSTSNTRALLPTWRRHQTSLRAEDEQEGEDNDEAGGLVMQYGEEEDEEEKEERREQLHSSYFQQRQQPAASFPSSKLSSLRPSSSPQQKRQKKRDVMMPPPPPPPPPTMWKMIAAGQKDSKRSSSSSTGIFDAQAALQRIQEAEQARREEAAAAKRQSKRGIVSFRPPMTSIDFQSPIVSEQVETLHRRKKRASVTIDIGGIGGGGGREAGYLPQEEEQEGGILLPHQVSIFEEKQRREEEERRAREAAEEEEAHRVFIPRFSSRFGWSQQQQRPVSIPSVPPQPQPPQTPHQTDTFSFLQRRRKAGATATATAPPMRREEESGIPMFAAASAAGAVNNHYQHASPYPTSIASTSSSPPPSFPSRRSREERHGVAAAPPMPPFTTLRPSWSSLSSPPRSESAFPLLSSSHHHHQQQQQQHPLPPQFPWEKTSPYHSSSSLLPTAPAFLTSTTTGLTFGPSPPLFNVLRENSPRRGDDINETSAWRPSFAASSTPSSFLKPAIPASKSSPPPLAPAASFLRQPSSLLYLPSDNLPQHQHHHHLLDRPSSATSTTTSLARGEGGDVMYAPSFLPRKQEKLPILGFSSYCYD